MQTLYFIRHGESEDNAGKVWSRKQVSLTEKGREQARLAGRAARSQGLQFDVMLVSPLPRTRQTAEIVAAELGHDTKNMELVDALVERDWGALEGTVHNKIFGRDFTREDIDTVDGAEKLAATQRRAQQVLEMIQGRPEANILIIGHGSFGRALRRAINGEPHTDEYDSEKVSRIYIQNAEIVQLI